MTARTHEDNRWTIRCVGVGEDEEARLRLLLRSASKQVTQEWMMVAEDEADLLLVDRRAGSDPAWLADAIANGATCAALLDAEDPVPGDRHLRRPFAVDALVAVLREVGGEHAPASTDVAPDSVAPDSIAPALAASPDAAPVPVPARPVVATTADDATHSLMYFLPKRVLGGPARIALADTPVLVLDPEARKFWAPASLLALEPYARQPLRFGDWEKLSPEGFAQACVGVAERPTLLLTWMDAYIHSGGVLSRRLDPNGDYSITRRLDLANDYPHALRVSAQMSRPRKLDAIARACGVGLPEVHDVVNAYDAIGFLEYTRAAAPPRR